MAEKFPGFTPTEIVHVSLNPETERNRQVKMLVIIEDMARQAQNNPSLKTAASLLVDQAQTRGGVFSQFLDTMLREQMTHMLVDASKVNTASSLVLSTLSRKLPDSGRF